MNDEHHAGTIRAFGIHDPRFHRRAVGQFDLDPFAVSR
jgi:hypothetical protein